MRLAVVLILLTLVGCTSPLAVSPATKSATLPSDGQVYARPLPEAIRDGVKFLQQSQQPDGSWGTGTETRGYEVVASVPGSYDGFKLATTSLAVMALKQAGETTSHDKGLEFIVTNRDVKRATPDLIYNVWAHTYAIQCLAMEMRDRTDPRIRVALDWHLDRLKRYQTFMGGWNYYDFGLGTQSPSNGPTSFGTAAGLIALWEAKQSGIPLEDSFIQRTVRRVEDMRTPEGNFEYAWHHIYLPRHPANRIRGSTGRNQACNDALLAWGSPKVTLQDVRVGLELFFKEHNFIEMGRKRQYPHESWYKTAAYYYYFGHYYASRLLGELPAGDRSKFAQQLEAVILPHQEPDGSWWDYAMWDYHKPYGTAFALMTLLNCQKAMATTAVDSSHPASAARVNHAPAKGLKPASSQNSAVERLDIR